MLLVEQYNKSYYSGSSCPYNMNEVINECIADPLSDYSIHSEDFDIQIEDSDSSVPPRKRSKVGPLQYSSNLDDSIQNVSNDYDLPTSVPVPTPYIQKFYHSERLSGDMKKQS